MDRKTTEFRCFCGRKPLLGVIRRNPKGKTIFHIKIYKQDRIFGEVFLETGSMQFRCRECYRIHRITIVRDTPSFQNGVENDLPEDVLIAT